MAEHGRVGRRVRGSGPANYFGSIGFDDWDGASTFADDPVVFKHLIYKCVIDQVSAVYAAVRIVLHWAKDAGHRDRKTAGGLGRLLLVVIPAPWLDRLRSAMCRSSARHQRDCVYALA